MNQISQRIVIKARIPCFDLGEKFLFWNKQYTSSSFVILLRIGLFISLSQIVLLGKKNIWGLNKKLLIEEKLFLDSLGCPVCYFFFLTIVSVVLIIVNKNPCPVFLWEFMSKHIFFFLSKFNSWLFLLLCEYSFLST